MLNILVLNGVNLDLLGIRQPDLYGSYSLKDIEDLLSKNFLDINFTFFQSNSETLFLEAITPNYDGIIINPGAWTHTSVAILDRLLAIRTPYVEVHLTNIFSREEFRHKSYISSGAIGMITGFRIDSYLYACQALQKYLKTTSK